jgi:uncharacterized beta-barrel protein YwiB (DUF1934 family)
VLMTNNVMLTIRSRQCYVGQDPDVIELVTEGRSYPGKDGWRISYEESDLTGLQGVTTTFLIQQDKITLDRTGRLQSTMVFQEGIRHESLYQMEFGALMMVVCAKKIVQNLSQNGGTVDLVYSIEIEHAMAGTVDYHLDVKLTDN